MQSYLIFYAAESCDTEWQPLGQLTADSVPDALARAKRQWPEYLLEDLVALEEAVTQGSEAAYAPTA